MATHCTAETVRSSTIGWEGSCAICNHKFCRGVGKDWVNRSKNNGPDWVGLPFTSSTNQPVGSRNLSSGRLWMWQPRMSFPIPAPGVQAKEKAEVLFRFKSLINSSRKWAELPIFHNRNGMKFLQEFWNSPEFVNMNTIYDRDIQKESNTKEE